MESLYLLPYQLIIPCVNEVKYYLQLIKMRHLIKTLLMQGTMLMFHFLQPFRLQVLATTKNLLQS